MTSLVKKRKRSSLETSIMIKGCDSRTLNLLSHFFKDPEEVKIEVMEGKISPFLSLKEGLSVLGGISMEGIEKGLMKGHLDAILHSLSKSFFRAIFVISCQGDAFEVYPKKAYSRSSVWAHRNAFLFMVRDEDGYHHIRFTYKGKALAFLTDSHLFEGNIHSLHSDPTQPEPILTSLATSLVKQMPSNQILFVE